MAYNESAKNATNKYIREKQHEIFVRFKKDEYENTILPAIKKTGLPIATFIKKAIYEKIKRDSL